VNPEGQFVLNQTSVEFLISRKGSQREALLKALRRLAANPTQPGDFLVKDDAGRDVSIKRFGKFMITYWNDSYVHELRVLRIEAL
jgi:hypothetical protein